MHPLPRISWRYLVAEAGLFLLLSYLVLFGGTFNGAILFDFNQVNFILVFFLGCAWLIWRFIGGRYFPDTVLDKPLFALTIACVLVTVFSVDPRRSAIILIQLLFYILLFYCLVDLFRAGLDVDLLTKVWLFTSLVVMLFSIIQIVFWYKSWIDLVGWHHPIPSTTIRISAFLGHPNIMAAYFNLLLPFGIVRAVQSRSRGGRAGWSIWAMLVIGLIFFTSSRGGWFGTAAVLGILTGLWVISKWANVKNSLGEFRRRKGLAVVLIVVLTGLVVIGAILLNWQSKNLSHASSGLDFMSRSYIWKVAWQSFIAHPFLGNGPFTFGTQFIQSVSVPPEMLLGHAHNFWFNVAAEAGIVGLAAFGWLSIVFIIFARKQWKTARGGNRITLASLFASLGGLAVHSLFDTPELLLLIGIMIVNFTAIVITMKEAPVKLVGIEHRQRNLNQAGGAVLLVVWLILTGAIGWGVWAYQPAAKGVELANSGNWASAAQDFDLAASRDPQLAFNWLQAGFARGQTALSPDGSLKDTGNLTLAISDYKRGISIEPVYATNWVDISLLEWAEGDYEAALDDIKKAVTVAPYQPAFKLTYGRMLEAEHRSDEARVAFRQVLEIAPDWAGSYFFRATPLRIDVVNKWRSETNRPWNTNSIVAPPTTLEISGFSLADNQNISNNKLALGISFTQQGNLKAAIRAFESGLDLLAQTTSFGIGELGNSPYGWSIFDRESIDADLLPGLDYPLYTDDVVNAMLVLADDYQKLGDPASAHRVYENILQVAPDCQAAIDKMK